MSDLPPINQKYGVDTTDFKAGMAAMNRELRVLESGFRATAAGLSDWSKDATGLETRIKSLTSQIGVQKDKVSALTTEYKRIATEKGENSRAAQDLQIKLNKETETLGKMQNELGTTEQALKGMGNESKDAGQGADQLAKGEDQAEGSTGKLKSALDKLRGGLKSVGSDFKNLGDKVLKSVAIGIAGVTAAITAAVAGLGVLVFGAGKELDEAYDTILIKTGATGATLAGLQGNFKDVFTSIPTDAGTAAEVISDLNQRLGLTGSNLTETSKKLIEMSRLTGGDASQNAALFARVIGDAGIPIEQSGALLDKLFKASQLTGVGMDSLMQQVVQFGAPMRLMGFTLDDSIALFAKWEKEGVNSELVMGSLRIAAGKFASEGKPLRESLLATFDSIKNNTDASKALADGMAIFGARAGPDMVAAIREGRFSIDDLVAALQGADGAILDTAAATEDFPEKLKKLGNKAKVALAPLSSALFGLAGTIVDKLSPVFDNLLPLIEKVAGTLGDMINSKEFQEGLDRVVKGIADFATTLGSVVEKLLKGDIRGALGELFPPETVNQILTISNTIRDFVQGVLIPFITEHAEGIKAAILAIGATLAAAGIVAAIAAIANPIGLIIAAVGLLAAAWTENWGGIRDKLTAVWVAIQPTLQTIWDWLKVNVPAALETLRAFWVDTAWPAIQTAVTTVWGILEPIWKSLKKWVSEDLPPALEGLKTTFEKIMTGITNAVTPVKELWDKLWQAVKDFWDWLSTHIFKFHIDLPKLPDWATPGSPLPIHTAWKNFAEDMERIGRNLPQIVNNATSAGIPSGNGISSQPTPAPVSVQVNAVLANELDMHVFARLIAEEIKISRR
jgi:phage-related minor tail protein